MRILKIFKNEKLLFSFFLKILKKLSKEAIEKKGFFTLALSGGKTPIKLFKELALHKEDISFEKFYIFFVDERCVPFKDERNNGKMIQKHLIKPLNIKNVFYVNTEKDPKVSALEYENFLKKFFSNKKPSFDLVMLGIGEDGHIASLFPNSPSLKEKKKLVIDTEKKGEDFKRISFTFPLINNSKNVIFLATGARKAEILKKLLKDKNKNLPASFIEAKKNVYVLMDRKSAFLIQKFLDP
jgi:6-phosphogluconolactonase